MYIVCFKIQQSSKIKPEKIQIETSCLIKKKSE